MIIESRLGDLVNIRTGKLDANASSDNGKYPFFTCSIMPLRIDNYSYDCECVLVAGNGDLNVKYYNGKFDAYQRTYIIEVKDKLKVNTKYLYYYMSKYIEVLRNQSIGGVIKYIKLANLTEAKIPIISLDKQIKIIEILDLAQMIIEKRKKSIELLDELVKSKFIEMFGDPITNSKEWNTFELREGIKEIKYGTSKPPIFSEEGIPFVRATNIKFGRIIENDMKYISEYEAEKIEKCKLSLGDTIIVRSGANTGDNAFVSEEYVGSYGGYDIIVKLNEKINYIFLNALLNSIYRETIIQPLTRRAGQPHLNSEQIQSLVIYNPPIELQNQFADFVKQVDKLKFEMEHSLKELEDNFNSLIQKIFKVDLL
ncbi:TPA: restriction endonuclease subunit S [Clostridium perfringens]|nr:restriction endonuclease subunit S [Clostridium perfringens]